MSTTPKYSPAQFAIAGAELAGRRSMDHGVLESGKVYRFAEEAPRGGGWTAPTAGEIDAAFPEYAGLNDKHTKHNSTTAGAGK